MTLNDSHKNVPHKKLFLVAMLASLSSMWDELKEESRDVNSNCCYAYSTLHVCLSNALETNGDAVS